MPAHTGDRKVFIPCMAWVNRGLTLPACLRVGLSTCRAVEAATMLHKVLAFCGDHACFRASGWVGGSSARALTSTNV